MGPNHSQIEIYEESRHGVVFAAQEKLLRLDADPRTLSTRDMFVPTCATCHMSGINGTKLTHNPGERLSYYLADAISKQRPNYQTAQTNMKPILQPVSFQTLIERVYQQAEDVVTSTNTKVEKSQVVIAGLHKDGVLGPQPFQTPIDFLAFDLALRRGHLQARCLHGRCRFCAMACTIKSLTPALLGGFARPAGTLFENVIAGAPPLAPLLLPKLSILGFIGIAAVLREAQT